MSNDENRGLPPKPIDNIVPSFANFTSLILNPHGYGAVVFGARLAAAEGTPHTVVTMHLTDLELLGKSIVDGVAKLRVLIEAQQKESIDGKRK